MLLLALGLALFTGTHLVLGMAPGFVAARRASLGEGPAKGIVALLSFAGIALTVVGWKGAEVDVLYVAQAGLRLPGLLLVATGIYLFVVANRPSRVKRVLRHPQLTGLMAWSAGHLLMNGENRSLLLFAWLGLWALVEILLINRRDRTWSAPEAPALTADVATLLVAFIACYFLAWVHPWIAGVAVLS